VVQNSNYSGNTEVKFNFGGRSGSQNLNIQDFDCFPAYPNDLTISIFKKVFSKHNTFKRIKSKFDSSKMETGIFPYYQSGSMLIERKRGVCFNYYNEKSDIFSMPKVIIGRETGDCYQFYCDVKGELGVDSDAHVFEIEDSGATEETVNSFFWSKLIRFYAQITPYGARVNDRAIKGICKKDLSKLWTDKEIYEEFKLTEEEIEFIETFIK
jgi:hypothetical protein